MTGPGTSRSDSIWAKLSNGEFVINAASTRKHRRLLEAINDNRDASPRGQGKIAYNGMPLAEGGYIQPPTVPAPMGGQAYSSNDNSGGGRDINIPISVVVNGDVADGAAKGEEIAAAMAPRLKEAVRSVIAAEQRGGGMLAGTKRR